MSKMWLVMEASNLSDLGDHRGALICLNKALLTSYTKSPNSSTDDISPTGGNGASPTSLECLASVPDKNMLRKNNSKSQLDECGYDEGMLTFSQMITISGPSMDPMLLPQRTIESIIFYNIGIVHTRLKDDQEALIYFKKAEFLKQQKDPQNDLVLTSEEWRKGGAKYGPSLVAILHNIGHIHFRAGHFADAEMAYRTALQRAQQHHSRDYLFHVAATLNCIGVTALYAFSDICPEESLAVISEAVDIFKNLDDRELLGATATAVNNLGRLKLLKGDTTNALLHFNEALNMRRKKFNGTHLDIAVTVFNIGETLHIQESFDEALDSYGEFLSIMSARFGENHSQVLLALTTIADCYHKKSDNNRALTHYLKALHSAIVINSPVHSENAAILNKIGNTYYEMGDLKSALKTYEEGLEIERKLNEADDRNMLVTVLNIARVFHNEKKLERALEFYQEGLTILRNYGAKEQLKVAGTLESIGLICDELGYTATAIESLEEALNIKKSILSRDHFDVSCTMNSLGLVLFHEGIHEDALEMFEDCLRIRKSSISASPRDVATVLYNIATVCLETDRFDKSLEYYTRCLALERSRKSKVGVISSLKRIGHIHTIRENYDCALKKYQEAIEICFDVSSLENTNHTEIAHVLGLMAKIYLSTGNVKLASQTYARAIRANRIAGLDDRANLNIDECILGVLIKKSGLNKEVY